MGPELSERDRADLCALADGTLPSTRRAEVEARVASSPELQRLLARQRLSLTATQALCDEPVPDGLTAAVEAAAARRPARHARAEGRPTRAPSTRRRGRLALGLSAAAAFAAVVVAVIVLSVGGPSGPSVADAAQLALQAPTAPAPAAASTTQLTAAVGGVNFPNLATSFGWQATGLHTGRVAGRDATFVSYEKNSRRIGYGIVSGPALDRPTSGHSVTLGGIQYQTISVNGRPAVTWREGGHTCVLIGSAPPSELLALASWSGSGQRY